MANVVDRPDSGRADATGTTGVAGADDPFVRPGGPSPRAILWAVGFSVFVAADDLTVVSTMLRPIISDLGLVLPDGLDDAAWIVNAYLIAFIAIMPIAGRISDVIGRRRTFLAAYAIFLVGTIWIPLSDSLGTLLAGRVMTAIGGGAMVPVALAVVGDVYPVRTRARALGTLGAIETLGWVWGPLYGAMLVRFLDWRWQFWLNIPLALVGMAAVWWALADHDRPDRTIRIDWLGAGLLTTGLISLNLALLGGAEVQSVQGLDELTGNGATDFRWLYGLAVVSGAAFVWQQRRRRRSGRDALVDGALFRGRNVRVALIVNFLVGAALVIAMVDVPLFVNAVEIDLERSAVVAGWILSALTAAMAVASYVGGRVTERTWYGPPIFAGLVAATSAYLLMGVTWNGDSPYPLLAAQLALLGAGVGLTIAPTTSAVVDHAEPDARGAAAGVVMVVRMIGLSVGLAALTAWGLARFNALRGDIELPPLTDPGFTDAVQAATRDLTAQSIADTFLASAAALGVGLVLCLVLLRRRATDIDPKEPMMTDTEKLDPEHTDTSSRADTSTAGDELDLDAPTDAPATPDGDPDGGGDAAHEPTRELVLYGDQPADHDAAGTSGSGIGTGTGTKIALAGLGLLALASIALSLFMLNEVRSTRDELDETRAELATTQEDLNRVEAGAALFASQVTGFTDEIGELGPSIDDGLDQAVTGLEDFGSSTIEFVVPIDETISISQEFSIDRTVTVPIDTTIPINTDFDTTITVDGPFGIEIPLDINVPVDVDVPVQLDADIPINESIPIAVDVPVQLEVPISLSVEGTELQALTDSLIEGLRAFQDGLGGLTGG
ncbi:MAG: MFS transporter [Actinomycetota bacterium]